MEFYNNVYEAITNNTPLAVTPTEARNVISIIEAAYQSQELGQVIALK